MLDEKKKQAFKEEIGFIPPGVMVAQDFGKDFQEMIAEYHHMIWGKGVIPLKYRYMIALATAIFDDNEKRAQLELTKAINHGASREELLEVLMQQVWMKGAPTMVQIAPLLNVINKKLPE